MKYDQTHEKNSHKSSYEESPTKIAFGKSVPLRKQAPLSPARDEKGHLIIPPAKLYMSPEKMRSPDKSRTRAYISKPRSRIYDDEIPRPGIYDDGIPRSRVFDDETAGVRYVEKKISNGGTHIDFPIAIPLPIDAMKARTMDSLDEKSS